MYENHVITGLAIAWTLLSGGAVAKPVTYDFTVDVTEGKLAGKSFDGSFSYDDEAVSETGTTAIGITEGLQVEMTFFDRSFTAEDDVNYPEFPQLVLEEGEVQKLEFWVEPGAERGSWWDLPGWNVELTPRESDPQ